MQRSIIFLSLLMLIFDASPAMAQAKPCRAKVRANRHKVITTSGLSLFSHKWTGWRDNTVVEYFRETGTAMISRDGSLIAKLKISRNNGLDVFTEYDSNNILRAVDSAVHRGRGHTKRFYNAFSSSYIKLSKTFYTSGQLESAIYYNYSGVDSVSKEWHSNGVPRLVKLYTNHAQDSLATRWYNTGIISSIKNSTMSCVYNIHGVLIEQEKILPCQWPGKPVSYPPLLLKWLAVYNDTGILRSLQFDTLINRYFTQCKKEYYSSGIIRSVKYYQDNLPCHIWLDYNTQGILIQTTKQMPVKEILLDEPGPAEPLTPEIFTFVEQMPEFMSGGSTGFEKYMAGQFSAFLCDSQYVLKGQYELKFDIKGNGSAMFIDITGYNSNLLLSGFKALIDAMPHWRPGKINGMPQDVTFIIKLEVKPR